MSAVAESHQSYDLGDVPLIVRSSIKLGIITAIVVFAFSLVSRYLSGTVEVALEALLLVIGVSFVAGLPAVWTKARTGDGIAAAAGVGLGGTVAFMAVDVILLQRIGTYTNRWLEIGGGSNWWYHPVWWMTGTYLAWMGAVVLANQASGTGSPSIPKMTATAIVFGSVVAVVAVIIGFPGAAWSFPTFGISLLPGFAIAALFSMMSRRRA
jgi:hypothetical protein